MTWKSIWQMYCIRELVKTHEFLRSKSKQIEEYKYMIELIKIRENKNIAEQAANWFHQKWGIPLEVYQESICDCIENKNIVPQWYLAID